MAEGLGGAEGLVLSMTLSGDGFLEAFYSVPISVGSSSTSFMMTIDCGSSDVWLASTSCNSYDCKRAGTSLYGWSANTVDSGTSAEFNYLTGYVQGNVVWDNFQVGNYTWPTQSLVSAVQLQDEHLSSNFVGLLGLALERNSVLVRHADQGLLQLPASTFTANIFGGANPPTNRILGVSLERPGQSKTGTPSLLSIGRHPSSVVPDPSKISYTPLIGDTFWRVPVTRISAWVPGEWSNDAYGAGTIQDLVLGPSGVIGSRSIWPLAIVDTGGARIITSRNLANSFWGAYGVSPASDGMYYVPCKTPMNVSIQIGGVEYPIHPLDMSYISSNDPSSANCIGAWQASDGLASADIILGAAFMRNVYTVLQYDSPVITSVQGRYDPFNSHPRLGLLSLTNWQKGLQDFYRVRVRGEALESPSGFGQGGGSSSGGASNGTFGDKDKKMSVGVMALIGIMSFFGVAAVLFGIRWWMMKRRWRRMREAAAAQGQTGEEAEKDVAEGVAIPRPPRLDKDEVYERAHSGAYNRESLMWDAEATTIVGSRSSKAINVKDRRKPGKTNSYVGSRVGLMGEWVEPDSDEDDVAVRSSVAVSASGQAGVNGARESWAAVRPRQTGDLDVLERANRTRSFAGVGAGDNVKFVGAGTSEYGRPLSMPMDISQFPGIVEDKDDSEGARIYHRQTYSRADSDVVTPLLSSGTRSPLGQATFAKGDLEGTRPSADELAQARPSVDVGLGGENGGAALSSLSEANTAGSETPGYKRSMDIASPGAHYDQRPR